MVGRVEGGHSLASRPRPRPRRRRPRGLARPRVDRGACTSFLRAPRSFVRASFRRQRRRGGGRLIAWWCDLTRCINNRARSSFSDRCRKRSEIRRRRERRLATSGKSVSSTRRVPIRGIAVTPFFVGHARRTDRESYRWDRRGRRSTRAVTAGRAYPEGAANVPIQSCVCAARCAVAFRAPWRRRAS